ncbi:hypothetical protein DRQ05_04850 [bacterium]|nr:MAG: hypothetical protein DRQ05_04850 [bacterium]
MMRKGILFILFLAGLLVISSGNTFAQLPDTLQLEFDFEGTGNAVLNSPPLYSGDITQGDPLVVGGTWWVQLDDSNWPSTSDPDTRWNYIFNTYYIYDPGSFSWTATFDGNTMPSKPTWEIDHPSNGTMGGTLVIQMTLYDWNMNGELDLDERTSGLFSGTMMVMKYGTGLFAGYCGEGSYNGSLSNSDPANYADDYVEGHCLLNLVNCAIGTQTASWSYIKSIFE